MSWQERMAALIAQRLGIEMRLCRSGDSLDRFVRRRSRALGLASGEAYVAMIEAQSGRGEEFSRLVAAVTIGYTFFFRNLGQLNTIAEMLAERAGRGPARIWCACCSTGEEAYSLAVLLAEERVAAEILATDVDVVALEAGRAGEYVDWSLRAVPKGLREEHFMRVGDRYRVRRHIRERVTFRRHNVVADPPPLTVEHRPWDVIICRNAFIYYTSEAQQQATQHFSRALGPDGFVFMGSSESLSAPMAPVGIKGQVAYRPASRLPAKQKPPRVMRALTPPPVPRRVLPRHQESPPPAKQAPRYDRALLLLAAGDEVAAQAMLEGVVLAHPDDSVAWTTLGTVSLRLHDFDRALQAYGEAQERDPINPEVHYFLGMTYRKLGDLERAAHSLRSALFLDPGFWPASFLLAGVCGRMGQQDKRRSQLRHTWEATQGEASRPLFRSHGHESLQPEGREAVALACRRQLSERQSAK